MRDRISISSNHFNLLFWLLILVAALIRFYEAGSFSLSNDELSAVFRAYQPDLMSLISEGVVKTDPHPAGVQVFLYFWLKIFSSPWAIRFPFIMSSLIALFFLYKLFTFWIGRQNALLALALFSFTLFVTIQSQLARPYAIGIMTVSIYLWTWNEFAINGNKNRWVLISFVVFGALNCYVHYYAALFTGIVGFAGLYFAWRNRVLKEYTIYSLISLLLFFPHVPVLYAQLSRGPLTSWIDPANSFFIWNHISVLLNKSWLMTYIYCGLLILSIVNLLRRKGNLRAFVLSFLFFVLPILLGHIYSWRFGSALMHRVLLFSSPFFYVLPFTGLPDLRKIIFIPLFGILSILMITLTLTSNSYSNRQYVENFKAITQDINEVRKGKNHVLLLGNFNSPDYVNFYSKKDPIQFVSSDLQGDQKLAEAMSIIRNSNADILSLSWSCKSTPSSIVEYAKTHFPAERYYHSYYNGGCWLFTKGRGARDTTLYEQIYKDTLMDSETEYLDIYSDTESAAMKPDISVNVKLNFEAEDVGNLHLVFSISTMIGEGDPLYWEGHKLKDFMKNNNEMFVHFRKESFMNEYFLIKGAVKYSIYLWNPDKKSVRLKNVLVSSYKDSFYRDLY